MTTADILVIVGGAGLIGFLLWFFFGPKKGKAAAIRAGVQEVTIRVEGAFQPSKVTVKAGCRCGFASTGARAPIVPSGWSFPAWISRAHFPPFRPRLLSSPLRSPASIPLPAG